MVNKNPLIAQDLKHIWHPCSQMKDFTVCPPLVVRRAKGSYLYTDQGPIIDAISSWWCKSLGHGHPKVKAAIQEQLQQFEHVIGANTTHTQIVRLAEQLAAMSGLEHLFFASDGSCAVEIALKLTLQANQIKGRPLRNQFMALRHAYHGETLATLSISDLGLYKKPFNQLGLTSHFLQSIPYVNSPEDPLWQDCQFVWEKTYLELEQHKEKLSAIVVEPLVQGAGGMRLYSADFLKKLAHYAKANDIYLIADEIMTGLGRTGQWFACDHAGIKPDLMCLSKGLTSGTLPLSCVLIDRDIFKLFYGDYEEGNSFLHSHTYSGNPLAVSAALATLQVMQTQGMIQQAAQLGTLLTQCFSEVAQRSGKLENIRSLGAWVAGDLIHAPGKRPDFQIHQEALKRGALLRPLGNTLYWLLPFTTSTQTVEHLAEITLAAIEAVY